MLLFGGVQTHDNFVLGQTLVTIGHRAQRTKKTRSFKGSGLSIGRSYAIKGSQKRFLSSRAELSSAVHSAFLDDAALTSVSQFTDDCRAWP